MSITRQVTVWCDGCSEWVQATGNARSLRKELKEKGWTYQRGKDFCDRCTRERASLDNSSKDVKSP
jgi:hypothetical protein